jgi:hypothetical protein
MSQARVRARHITTAVGTPSGLRATGLDSSSEVQDQLIHAAAGVALLQVRGQLRHEAMGRHVVARHRGREAADAEQPRLGGELLAQQ